MDRPSLFIMPITRERTKPKRFCGEARRKEREGEGACMCANGLHLITTNPDNEFFYRKAYPWRKVCFMSTFLFRSILQDPSRQVSGPQGTPDVSRKRTKESRCKISATATRADFPVVMISVTGDRGASGSLTLTPIFVESFFAAVLPLGSLVDSFCTRP